MSESVLREVQTKQELDRMIEVTWKSYHKLYQCVIHPSENEWSMKV